MVRFNVRQVFVRIYFVNYVLKVVQINKIKNSASEVVHFPLIIITQGGIPQSRIGKYF